MFEWIMGRSKQAVSSPSEIKNTDAVELGGGLSSSSAILFGYDQTPRTRLEIYAKYANMLSTGICGSAIKHHVSAAIGGHESTGQSIFIETKSEFVGKKEEKIVAQITKEIAPLLENVVFPVCFNALGFGDSYARIATEDKNGVIGLVFDERAHPSLVIPYEDELTGATIGYLVTVGNGKQEKLDVQKLARMKMPRVHFVPQTGVYFKERDGFSFNRETSGASPSLVGGSLLTLAESDFDKLQATDSGLCASRWKSAIDEQIMTVNVAGMDRSSRSRFLGSVQKMLAMSKDVADVAVRTGKLFLERLYHIIPVSNDKQLASLQSTQNQSLASSIVTDDVMYYAKRVAGALGIDLSMLGFSDILSGGLGDGGFFRVSIQSAEVARDIRKAFSDFANHVIDVHMHMKFGFTFDDGERPYDIGFFNSISSLESERAKTQSDKMIAAAQIAQTLQQLKDLGMDAAAVKLFLTSQMLLDEKQAEVFSKVVNAPSSDSGENNGAL